MINKQLSCSKVSDLAQYRHASPLRRDAQNQLAEQLAAEKAASDAQHAELTRAQAQLVAKTHELGDMPAQLQEH